MAKHVDYTRPLNQQPRTNDLSSRGYWGINSPLPMTETTASRLRVGDRFMQGTIVDVRSTDYVVRINVDNGSSYELDPTMTTYVFA